MTKRIIGRKELVEAAEQCSNRSELCRMLGGISAYKLELAERQSKIDLDHYLKPKSTEEELCEEALKVVGEMYERHEPVDICASKMWQLTGIRYRESSLKSKLNRMGYRRSGAMCTKVTMNVTAKRLKLLRTIGAEMLHSYIALLALTKHPINEKRREEAKENIEAIEAGLRPGVDWSSEELAELCEESYKWMLDEYRLMLDYVVVENLPIAYYTSSTAQESVGDLKRFLRHVAVYQDIEDEKVEVRVESEPLVRELIRWAESHFIWEACCDKQETIGSGLIGAFKEASKTYRAKLRRRSTILDKKGITQDQRLDFLDDMSDTEIDRIANEVVPEALEKIMEKARQ
jgi:hypothetical protein